MQTSILNIQNELDKARERLKGVEEHIKKSIGRDINTGPPIARPGFKRPARQLDTPNETTPRPRFQNEGIKSRLGDFVRSNDREPDFRGRVNLNRRVTTNEPPSRIRKVEKIEERIPAKKRLGEQPTAVTVFSRLSGPPKDDDFDDKESSVKITSQVIVQDAPSRKDVLAAQNGDNQSKARNRRMFGALLGTLQKFRQEENQLKEKEDKRAQVEKKLEEAALREKEELKKQRQELFSTRRQEQIQIRQLEYKLLRLKQLTEWESTKKHLLNFISTKSTPKIFYLPKIHNEKTSQLLEESRKNIEKIIAEKRAEVEKAIADHAAIKKEPKEVGDPHPEDDEHVEMMDEEEEGEVREVIFNRDINGVNRGHIEQEEQEEEDAETRVKMEDSNGISDKENDIQEEERDEMEEEKENGNASVKSEESESQDDNMGETT